MMEKEDILAKSRAENKNQDIYEKEVMIKGGNVGAITAAIVATVFFSVQIFVGEGINYGLYAVVFSILASGFIYKSIKLKKKHEIIVAVLYTVTTLIFATAHIISLISSSTIL